MPRVPATLRPVTPAKGGGAVSPGCEQLRHRASWPEYVEAAARVVRDVQGVEAADAELPRVTRHVPGRVLPEGGFQWDHPTEVQGGFQEDHRGLANLREPDLEGKKFLDKKLSRPGTRASSTG